VWVVGMEGEQEKEKIMLKAGLLKIVMLDLIISKKMIIGMISVMVGVLA